jgi:hypothetical protein
LAYGYDLDGTKLTIHIWDPNRPSDESSAIRLDIGEPKSATAMSVTHYRDGEFRGFFRTHYTFKDPSKATAVALAGQQVSSPGITPEGPIPAVATKREWLAENGQPLAPCTTAGADWSHAVSANPADAGQPIVQLMATIKTGKIYSVANAKNASVTLGLADGTSVSCDVTDGIRWNANEVHKVVLPLPSGTRSGDVVSIKYSGGSTDVLGIGLDAYLRMREK